MVAASSDSVGHAPSLSTGVIAGIAGAGAGILILIVCITILIILARKQHKRKIADLESRGIAISRGPSIAEISDVGAHRTRTVLRRNTNFVPYGANGSGWDSLHSNDSWKSGQPPNIIGPSHPPVQPLSTFGTSPSASKPTFKWPFGKRNRVPPIAHGSRLSAITEAYCESPRSQMPVPIITDPDDDDDDPFCPRKTVRDPQPDTISHAETPTTEQHRKSSPMLDVPALPAMKPPALFAVGQEDHVRQLQGSRSKSMAWLPDSDRDLTAPKMRPSMHQRSKSLCTQQSGHVPLAPAPPLPVYLTADEKRKSLIQTSPSRVSISSIGSGGSSVLIHSPTPAMKHSNSCKSVGGSLRSWRTSLLGGPRPLHDSGSPVHINPGPRRHHTVDARAFIGSSVPRHSGASFDFKLSRANSVASSLASHNEGPSSNKSTATERVSRVSSVSPIKQAHTPVSRRTLRFFVDAKGSPSAKYKSPALPVGPSTPSPVRSSVSVTVEGSTFAFEPSPMQSGSKPSALKGSPNGRKGHKRQNCVRIKLAPTILGPSPPRMKQIQEEDSSHSGRSEDSYTPPLEMRSDPIRPPSSHMFAPKVRSRTSFTVDSPTLSLVNFCRDNGLPLENLGLTSSHSTPRKRASTVMGPRSPVISMSAFPSPGRESNKRSFSFSMPHLTAPEAADEPSSPLTDSSANDSYRDAPSSPINEALPSLTATPATDDLAAAFLSLSSDGLKTSPKLGSPGGKHILNSSPPSLRTVQAGGQIERPLSPRNLNEFSSPVSPKSQPRSSAFAGSLLVTEPVEVPQQVPVNVPLAQREFSPSPNRRSSSRAPSRASTIIGPRGPPALPLGKQVQMLRRMNSDVDHDHRAERRYLGFGNRAASPALEKDIYRDSYADFSPFGYAEVEVLPQEPVEMDHLSADPVGLGILGTDPEVQSEIDIDDMLRPSVCGSDRTVELEGQDDLSWLNSDDTNPWIREDSGTLGSAERIQRLYSNGSSSAGAGAEESRRGSVWNDGEKFWEMLHDGAQSAHSSPSPTPHVVPGLAITTDNDVAKGAVKDVFYIPGLSLTTATPSTSPQHAAGTFSVAGAELEDVGARSSWGLRSLSLRKKPERKVTMRKSAILSMALSAGNRQKKASREGEKDNGREDIKMSEPVKGPKKEWGTPGSLYDEDGFLKG